ncbi:hypothetical protein ES703_61753 [subsurface metagenome]
MPDSLLDLVKSSFSWVIRRTFGSLRVKVQNTRVVGEQEKSGLAITVTIENPQSQNAFVERFEVMMLEPFQGFAVRYEFRVAGAEGNVESLPINISGHGISRALTVVAHFDKDMSSLNKHYKAKIAAIG